MRYTITCITSYLVTPNYADQKHRLTIAIYHEESFDQNFVTFQKGKIFRYYHFLKPLCSFANKCRGVTLRHA